MSKGLEVLKHLYAKLSCKSAIKEDIDENLQEYDVIKKELKALEIIKRMYRPTEHQLKVPLKTEMITQEEYDLLKEVML